METEFLYIAQYEDGSFEGTFEKVSKIKDALKISDTDGFELHMNFYGKSGYKFIKIKCSYEFV